MKQRVGDKKRRQLENKLDRPIKSLWARGGRNPRYWDVIFEDGEFGYWFTATESLEMKERAKNG